MKYLLGILILFNFSALHIRAQETHFAIWDSVHLTLNNGVIKRSIALGNSIHTQFMGLCNSKAGVLATEDAQEFHFNINGISYDGKSNWKIIGVKEIVEKNNGNGVTLSLQNVSAKETHVQVDITYILYPGLPLIRKRIWIKNLSSADVKIESVDTEVLPLSWDPTNSWIMNNFARQKHLGPFEGNWNDPAVVVHDIRNNRGILLGNEAPGVTKKHCFS
ncbi:MAG: hypothetical protein HC830_12675 [Bacteroidetes bacterium]|nr:hypothetical protein [Bacteroidota bacterium]